MEIIAIILVGLMAFRILRNIIDVMKEKLALQNNVVIIDNENVSNEDLERANVKVFLIQGIKIHAGDRIRVITKFKDRLEGMVVGADAKAESLIIASDYDVMDIQFKKIKEVKLMSRYGRFFTFPINHEK